MYPKVAIIILNYHGLQDTLDCLHSIKEMDYPNYNVFVVDNGSGNNEATKIKAAYPEVNLIALSENTGFTGGNNLVLRSIPYSDYDYALLLNNDTVVSKDFLRQMVLTGESNELIGIVGCRICCPGYEESFPNFVDDGSQGPMPVWYNGAHVNNWTGITHHEYDWKQNNCFNTDYISGCCMLIKKQVIKDIGVLYDRYFAYCEDLDYCVKARKHNWRCTVNQYASIFHRVSKASKQISNFGYFYYLRNRIIFMRQNSDALHLAFFYPYYLFRYIIPYFLVNLFTGNKERLGLTIKAVSEGFNNG
jgi:GT2 family glycosyltransferase